MVAQDQRAVAAPAANPCSRSRIMRPPARARRCTPSRDRRRPAARRNAAAAARGPRTPAGRSGSRPSASLIVAPNFAGSAVSMQTSGTRGSRRSSPTLIPSAVCGSTTIRCARMQPRIVAMRSACVLTPETKPEAATRSQCGAPASSKPPSRSMLRPQRAHDGGIAADDVEHVALEVRRLRDVHRRARRRVRLARAGAAGSARCGRTRRARRSRWSRGSAGGSAGPSARATCPARMLPKLPDGTAKSTGSPCAFVTAK